MAGLTARFLEAAVITASFRFPGAGAMLRGIDILRLPHGQDRITGKDG